LKLKGEKGMKKGLRFALLTICILVLAAGLCACGSEVAPESKPLPPAKPSTFLTVDVNPSLEFVIDNFGKVMSVNGVNSDANVLLYNEGGIVGSPYSVALKNVLSLSKNMGYLEDGAKVALGLAGGDLKYEEVKDCLDSAAEKLEANIEVVSADENDLIYASELDELKAKNAADGSMTVTEYRLMKRALEIGGEAATDVYTSSQEQLLTSVQRAWSDADSRLGESYRQASNDMKFEYDFSREFAKNSVYVSYFVDLTLNSSGLDFIDYSAKTISAVTYVNATALSKAFEYAASRLFEARQNPVFEADSAELVYEVLKPFTELTLDEFKQKILDYDGRFTLSDLNAIMNSMFRNTGEASRETFKTAYYAVKEILSEAADVSVESIAKEIIEIYKKSYETIVSETSEILKDNPMFEQFSDFLINVADSLITSCGTITEELRKTLETLREVLADLSESCFENLELSEEQLELIGEMQTKRLEELKQLKEDCAENINDLKERVASWYENLKVKFTNEAA